jgi:hypothetical protein
LMVAPDDVGNGAKVLIVYVNAGGNGQDNS